MFDKMCFPVFTEKTNSMLQDPEKSFCKSEKDFRNSLFCPPRDIANSRQIVLPASDPQLKDFNEPFSQVIKQERKAGKTLTNKYDTLKKPRCTNKSPAWGCPKNWEPEPWMPKDMEPMPWTARGMEPKQWVPNAKAGGARPWGLDRPPPAVD